jgi:hypothetical protein
MTAVPEATPEERSPGMGFRHKIFEIFLIFSLSAPNQP